MGAPLYLAPPSTTRIRARIAAGQLGAILNPASGNRMPEQGLFAVDNAVYGGHYPGDGPYLKYLERFVPHADRCLFVTAPDRVGNALATEARSRPMLAQIRAMGLPVALVAQDHMEFASTWDPWEEVNCLFVGGSTEWKLSDAAANLARVASSLGKHVHVGRVNSLLRYRHAALVMLADSVDGTYLQRAGPDRALPTVLGWRDALLADPLIDVSPRELDWLDGGYILAPSRSPETAPAVDQITLF
ncbi:hypothetical protein AB0K21_21595 [Streptosporangium sp. NPDC049248]|uniref:hypothetical protein n=1 Tax=Streptosporangium sp. NPDC049248 TaxID=3155651 RepID=UPI0034308E8B